MNQKTKRLMLTGLYVVIGAVAAYFLLPTVLSLFLPLIVAAIIAALIEPLVSYMVTKLRMPRSLSAAISILVTLIVLGGLATMIIAKISSEIGSLIDNWPGIYVGIQDQMSMWFNNWSDFYITMPPGVQNVLNTAYETASRELTTYLKPVADVSLQFAKNFAMGLPGAFIFMIVTFLSAYFMASDGKRISKIFGQILPKRLVERFTAIKQELKRALGGYLRAQGIMMSIVFVVVLAGMLIMRVPYALVIAIGIAIFDALPVFGSGGILIPWAVVSFIMNDMRMGIGLFILYFVLIITRQLIEPKIVSQQIGLPPIFTITAMYAGLKLFGIVGMICGPILVLLIKSLYASGAFDSILEHRNQNGSEANLSSKQSTENKEGV